MLDINERLNNLEARLLDIEIRLGMIAPANPTPPRIAAPPSTATAAIAAAPRSPARTPPREPSEAVSATQLMAWAAGFALLLAAVYFLKLVYDVGCLTPERQIILATLAGFALIAG